MEQRLPNYILILDLTLGFNGLGKDNWMQDDTRNILFLGFGVTYIRGLVVLLEPDVLVNESALLAMRRTVHQPGQIIGLILGFRPANERRRYFVTTSLIDWAQT